MRADRIKTAERERTVGSTAITKQVGVAVIKAGCVGSHHGITVLATCIEGQRRRRLTDTETVVAKLSSRVIGVVHHVVAVAVLNDKRALGHAVVHSLPRARLRAELQDSIARKSEIPVHGTPPDGIAVGELNHIEIELAIIVAEDHRVNAILEPLVIPHLTVRSGDDGRRRMSNMYDVTVGSPVVNTEKQVEQPSRIAYIVSMHLVVLCPGAVRPQVVEVEHVHALVPVNKVVAHKEIAIGGNTAKVVLAGILHATGIGNPSDDGIESMLPIGKDGNEKKTNNCCPLHRDRF